MYGRLYFKWRYISILPIEICLDWKLFLENKKWWKENREREGMFWDSNCLKVNCENWFLRVELIMMINHLTKNASLIKRKVQLLIVPTVLLFAHWFLCSRFQQAPELFLFYCRYFSFFSLWWKKYKMKSEWNKRCG